MKFTVSRSRHFQSQWRLHLLEIRIPSFDSYSRTIFDSLSVFLDSSFTRKSRALPFPAHHHNHEGLSRLWSDRDDDSFLWSKREDAELTSFCIRGMHADFKEENSSFVKVVLSLTPFFVTMNLTAFFTTWISLSSLSNFSNPPEVPP